MLRNYFKIALRNLLRHKLYSFINIAGLAVGIAFCLLIGMYVLHELRVNSQLRNVSQQHIILSKWKSEDMGIPLTTLAPLGLTLKEQYPGLVANYYRFHGVTATVSRENRHFREDIQVGDSTLLTMFDFPLLHGNPATAMHTPDAVVLTEEIAVKYFGKTNVLNQLLTIETPSAGKKQFIITGVLKSMPFNSVSDFVSDDQIFIPMANIKHFTGGIEADKQWQNRFIVNFIELQKGVTPADLEQPAKQILAQYAPEDVKGNLAVSFQQLQNYYLQANNGVVQQMVIVLSCIGLFILLMAIINFVNITIGISSSRLREIGIRKVLGGVKKELIIQFLVESLVLTCLSFMLSVFIYEGLRPFFNDLLARELPPLLSLDGYILLTIPVLGVIIGLLAGAYPAFILSALPSIDSLKGRVKSVKEDVLLKRALIIFQFVVAIFVFAASIIISEQVSYFFNKNLGYTKDKLLVVSSVPRDWSEAGVNKFESIKAEFLRMPEVQQVSLSYEIPNGNAGGQGNFYTEGTDSTQFIPMTVLITDENFASTYQIKMKEGQFFHANQGTYHPDRVVLNEAAAKAFGWDKAVGNKIKLQGASGPFEVYGVTENFHFASMHEAIRPIVFIHVKNRLIYRNLSFRLQTGNLRETIASIEKKWASTFPDAPFDYAFMDDKLQQLYQTEIQLRKASNVATLLSLIIVLLGVSGLISLNVAKRTKEVGVRKVLGATVANIIILFLKEFALLIVIANLIAWPLVYIVMNNWLQDYVYRITISWLPFTIAGIVTLIVTCLVVGIQSIKAALTNPVTSLRNE